ncbi:Bud-site selection protein BUD22 [Neofusicoccum parvum]|uniref:Bud-site selection protein BUD22 n=1 Tax=Neofusicoccum parvum TaxID=310453 RepID=A0ACB5RSY3_9PEZI|nr:Bud-site selection protein BUD22 [Neofusicoccum parvum]
MPKRKRSDDSEQPAAAAPAASDRATARQRKHLPPRLEQGKKALNKALRVSRGFERQKLSRRRKAAEKEGKAKEVERIDAEIGALKKVEYHVLAETHLYKTLLKIKSVAEHPALPPWVKVPEGKGKGDAAVMNVQARLFNANPTKEAMGEVVRDVRAILGLEEGGKGPKTKKAKGGEEKVGKVKARIATPESSEENSGEESVDDGEEGEWDSEEFEGFSERIAASSDEESEEDIKAALKRNYKPVRDLSFTPPSSREASPSPSPEPTFSDDSASESSESAPKSKSKAKDSVITNKSTFLPSLSAVGYISGSESEAEDLDEDIAPPKKNRRGQRARQQLWEKKYGKEAKHLGKQKEKEKNDRNAGWDAKRGAVDGAGGRGKGRFGRSDRGENRGGRGPKATDANLVELGKKKDHRDDAGKLHPSWEAAKKAKEKAKLGNVQFQGKKVVFD